MSLGPKDIATEIKNPHPVSSQYKLRGDYEPVANPNVYPNRCVGQILIRLRDGRYVQGSGSLVSDYTVLTAGHVVKDDNNEFLDIEEFQFIPARNHADQPYGVYDYYSIKGVYNGIGGSRDWALISLAQPAGFQTGFLGTMALYPISRWKTERYRFQHIGFPVNHDDEMWIDRDGECSDIYQGRQIITTDIVSIFGQSGGPLTINWGPANPTVCGCLAGGVHSKDGPRPTFTPGYEDVKTDVWMQVLCDEYGNLHSDDRFEPCSTRIIGDSTTTQGKLPKYDVPMSSL